MNDLRLSIAYLCVFFSFTASADTSPVAQADCLRFLSGGFNARAGFTASVAVGLFEMSDRDLKVRVPEGASIVLDRLVDKGADLTKLEKILSENWLMGVKAGESGLADRQLTEDNIRAAISDQSLHVLAKLTFEFFSVLEQVLFSKPKLAAEVREVVLVDLRRRISQEKVEQAGAQDAVQKVKRFDLRFEPTSTGAVFEPFDHPTMRESVKDPSGRVWSKALLGVFKNVGAVQNGSVTNSEAVKACEKIGGRLPSKEDYEEWRTYFELENHQNAQNQQKLTLQGIADLHRIFPDMKDRSFWSSSIVPSSSDYSYVVVGSVGYVVFDFRFMGFAVRCVAQ